MQQILPIFPQDIKMVNYQVGLKKMDDFVHYFVNGMPVFVPYDTNIGGRGVEQGNTAFITFWGGLNNFSNLSK